MTTTVAVAVMAAVVAVAVVVAAEVVAAAAGRESGGVDASFTFAPHQTERRGGFGAVEGQCGRARRCATVDACHH